jgi:hypothetical protein
MQIIINYDENAGKLLSKILLEQSRKERVDKVKKEVLKEVFQK